MRRELSLVGETKDKAIEEPGVVWEHAVKEKGRKMKNELKRGGKSKQRSDLVS